MDTSQKWEHYNYCKGEVILEDNHIQTIGLSNKSYYPFDYPNLPNALAKVTTSNKAIKFIEKYGLLGYYLLVGDYDNSYYSKGDLLEWILLHAKSIKLALQLIEVLEFEDYHKIHSIVKENLVKVNINIFPKYKWLPGEENVKVDAIKLADGCEILYKLYEKEGWLKDPRTNIISLLREIINCNTLNVRRTLVFHEKQKYSKEYTLSSKLTSKALIEVIWYLVGELVIVTQDNENGEKSGKKIGVCEECGLPFIVTDLRQKFCPKDPFSTESICASRHRKREWDRSKKED